MGDMSNYTEFLGLKNVLQATTQKWKIIYKKEKIGFCFNISTLFDTGRYQEGWKCAIRIVPNPVVHI